MEALISSLHEQGVFAVAHASDVAAVRRASQKLADELGFDEVRAGRVAIIVTEAATNLLKHAGEGVVYVMRAQCAAGLPGIDVVAVDKGPGIPDLSFSLQDGVSTAGTSGTGLGALRRQSDEFDVWTARERGTAFFMRVWRDAPPASPSIHDAPRPSCPLEIGALCVPLAGEEACGDGWAVRCDDDGATLLGVDGLGHGPEAAKAARGAVTALQDTRSNAPGDVVHAAHEAMRITRGAALSVARIEHAGSEVRFAGIGNVSGIVVDGTQRRALVSHNGIVGHNMRKVQEFTVACPPGALCIFHSDGLQTQWSLADYPGLEGRAVVLVAAILIRDFSRRRDDTMVLVARHGGARV